MERRRHLKNLENWKSPKDGENKGLRKSKDKPHNPNTHTRTHTHARTHAHARVLPNTTPVDGTVELQEKTRTVFLVDHGLGG